MSKKIVPQTDPASQTPKKLTAGNTPALAYVKRTYNARIFRAFSQDVNTNGLDKAIDWFLTHYVREPYRAQVRAALAPVPTPAAKSETPVNEPHWHTFVEQQDGTYGIDGRAIPFLKCKVCGSVKFYDSDHAEDAVTYAEYMSARDEYQKQTPAEPPAAPMTALSETERDLPPFPYFIDYTSMTLEQLRTAMMRPARDLTMQEAVWHHNAIEIYISIREREAKIIKLAAEITEFQIAYAKQFLPLDNDAGRAALDGEAK